MTNLSRRDQIALDLLKAVAFSTLVVPDDETIDQIIAGTDRFIARLDAEKPDTIKVAPTPDAAPVEAPLPAKPVAAEKPKGKVKTPAATKAQKAAPIEPKAADENDYLTLYDTRTVILDALKKKDKSMLEELVRLLDKSSKMKMFAHVSFKDQIDEAKMALQRYELYDGEVPGLEKMEAELVKYKTMLDAGEEIPLQKSEAQEIKIGKGVSPQQAAAPAPAVAHNPDDDDF